MVPQPHGGRLRHGGFTRNERLTSKHSIARAEEILALAKERGRLAAPPPPDSVLSAVSAFVPLRLHDDGYQIGHCPACHAHGESLCVDGEEFRCAACGISGGIADWLELVDSDSEHITKALCASWAKANRVRAEEARAATRRRRPSSK